MFRRHPDLFLHSYASMIAKVDYLKRSLNRQLQREKAFPLLLHFNYREVIWPRGELMKAKGYRDYDLVDVFGKSDEDFCKKFNFPLNQLQAKKDSRGPLEERD